jgi:pyruvate/2-oxoacid:ferredoxin oxidoreductase beta subunit
MDKFSLYVPNFLPCKEYFEPGKNYACPGCGLSLALRHTYKAAEHLIEKATWQTYSGDGLFGSKTAVSILNINQKKNDLTICFDNEAEGGLKEALKKVMPGIAVAEGFKYVATACPSYPFDLYDKIKKALGTQGKSYIHILCPCPAGWLFEPEDTVKMGFSAVESRAFPLYEVICGFYTLTVNTPKPRSLSDYLFAQKRFSKITEADIESSTETVDKEYRDLLDRIESGFSYTYETTGNVY